MGAGIDILNPFEVQAEMDVLTIRRKYRNDLRIWGGVDKRPLTHGSGKNDRELECVAPLIRGGDRAPAQDHSATPVVPYENYRCSLSRLGSIL